MELVLFCSYSRLQSCGKADHILECVCGNLCPFIQTCICEIGPDLWFCMVYSLVAELLLLVDVPFHEVKHTDEINIVHICSTVPTHHAKSAAPQRPSPFTAALLLLYWRNFSHKSLKWDRRSEICVQNTDCKSADATISTELNVTHAIILNLPGFIMA